MKVLVSSPLPGNPEKEFEKLGFEVEVLSERHSSDDFVKAMSRNPAGVVSLLSDRIDEEVLSKCPALKGIANYAVGFNNIDIEACTRMGIPVTNTPDVLTEATADLAMILILMCFRRIPEAMDFMRAGKFDGWHPSLMLGKEIYGKTLGIIGMGRIGQAVARKATGFGMKVVYYNSSGRKPEIPYEYLEFDSLLRESDVISLHVPLTPKTRYMLNRENIFKMKKGAILVNTSRGPVVEEAALVEALKTNHLYGAGLDVFEEEPKVHPGLWDIPNVVLLPHIGSATVETREKMGTLAIRSLIEVLQGGKPTNTVNPQVYSTLLWQQKVLGK